MEHRLAYDPRFSRPGVWMLNALMSGVRVRVIVLEHERVVDFECRWHRHAQDAPEAIYVHPLFVHEDKSETWATERFEIGFAPAIPLALVLQDAPVHIAAALRRL